MQKRSIFNVTVESKIQRTSFSRNLIPNDINFKMGHSLYILITEDYFIFLKYQMFSIVLILRH